MESREDLFFFLLLFLVLDRVSALSSEEEDEEEDDEESLDLRLDFLLEDFFLWDFLLARSDLTDLWLLSLSISLTELQASRLAELLLLLSD